MYRNFRTKHFLVKIVNTNVVWIPLVSVFWGSGVVSGIRGKQMMP